MLGQWLLLLCLCQSATAAWFPHGDYEYHIEPHEGSTISEATNACGMQSAVLATVKTIGVHNFLKTTASGVPGSAKLWLGLFDIGIDSEVYIWSDGSNLQAGEEKWSDGVPNQTLLHCVHTEADSHLWKSDMCSERYGFICQRKVSTPGWMKFETLEFLVNFAAGISYAEAIEECKREGGSLATPSQQTVVDFLHSHITPATGPLWIGLSDKRVWADGTVLDAAGILSVDSSPPDNCFHVDNEFNVMGESCGSTGGFICQRTQPDSWHEFADSEYLITPWKGFTQAEAKCECAKRKASLVSITSHEEYYFLRGITALLSTGFPSLWIGLENFEALDAAEFKWPDFSDLNGENWWAVQQPAVNGRCVIATDYCMEWNVTSCVEQSGFICERPIDIDDCLEDSCLNNGVCVDELFDFTCLCTPGYTGKDCSSELTPGGVDFLADELVLNCSLDRLTASLSGDYVTSLNFGEVDGLVMLGPHGSTLDGCQSTFDMDQNIYNFDFSEEFAQCSASQKEISAMYVVVDYIMAPQYKTIAVMEKCNNKILRFDCTYKRPNITDTIVTKFFAGKVEGHLSLSISRYESVLFGVKQSTYDITIGERVFIGVSLNLRNSNLLLLQGLSCWISQEEYYEGMDSANFYYILENGCPVDDPELGSGANLVYESHESKHVRFSFLPFLWSHSQLIEQSLWVTCSVKACLSEGNTACGRQDCNASKKRRSIHEEKNPGGIIALERLIVRGQTSCPLDNPCSHLCVTERGGELICSCPQNMYLMADQKTCADVGGSQWMLIYMWPVQLFTCITTILLWFVFLAGVLHALKRRSQTSPRIVG